MERRTIGWSAGVMALAAGIIYLLFMMQEPAPPAPQPAVRAASSQFAAPTMPKGYNPNQIIKDPFTPPAQAVNEGANKLSAPKNSGITSPSAKKAALPVLSGIVSAGARNSAVLLYGGESKSYQVNDYVGPYRVAAIDPGGVVLSGPLGQVVLKMEGD